MDLSLFATWEDLRNSNTEFKFRLKFFTVCIFYVIADKQLNMVCNIKFVPLTKRHVFTITILQSIQTGSFHIT